MKKIIILFNGIRPARKNCINENDSGKKNVADETLRKQTSNTQNDNGGEKNAVGGGESNSHDHDSPDNNNDKTSSVSSPVDSSGMAMVAVKNRSDPDKIISPTSPSSSTPSSKAMNLVEQARRNRLAAEQAARFLLSRFSSASMHSISQGVVISPTGSDNNNGRSGGTSSFPLRPTCQSNSTTSINSVTSNLSNISGESDGGPESLSLSSPSVAAADEKDLEERQRQKKEGEQEQTSTDMTVTNGVTNGMEVAINEENMKSSKAGVSSSSPTSSSTTFRYDWNKKKHIMLQYKCNMYYVEVDAARPICV